MAAARRLKRVAISQPGFLTLNPKVTPTDLVSSRRKRVNKNKKKNWNKYSDVQDVEEFLEDVRHQERTTGGLLSEKSDDSLFFLDVGQPKKVEEKDQKILERHHAKEIQEQMTNVLAYQKPNAKKLRRTAERAEKLAAKGVVPRSKKRLLNRTVVDRTSKKTETEANNNPERDFYDIWGQESEFCVFIYVHPMMIPSLRSQYFLLGNVKTNMELKCLSITADRPEKLNEKPSVLPAVEVIAPGGSYNPDFFSHQDLLREAHEVELKKKKVEDKLERQLAYNKEDRATEETILREQVEGLVEESEEEEEKDAPKEDGEEVAVGAIAVADKKTERQRKREKAEKIKEQQRLTERRQTEQQQQLFQLRSIKTSIKQQEETTQIRQKRRKAKEEAQKAQPRRLGKLKFQPQDMEVQLSDELAGSLRQLKPEGSVLMDRFKSLQKRNLIEPRERAKFKRRLKVKYVEKRAFKEIS
ncbi:ribosome biogenesis protein NOP53 [Neolamprologus brichardi]|uniref:ribosome biogenesis protein NOP53 n=1 Tax=Neolamprologus brichardi TaxID=32507 RepID=UPI0016437ED1|nr:ribosome biogenesis protein NOP53 [Neolamprologus brichardi]